jgi:hypothetical protein
LRYSPKNIDDVAGENAEPELSVILSLVDDNGGLIALREMEFRDRIQHVALMLKAFC